MKLDDVASQADLRELNQRTDASVEEDLPQSDVSVVDLPQDLLVFEAVWAYENAPEVEYAEPNFLLKPAAVPNDPSFDRLYALSNMGQTGGTPDADVDAPEAWDITTGSAGVVVAVIDEGVDTSHPDLRDNIWTNPGKIAGNRIDDDNGYVDKGVKISNNSWGGGGKSRALQDAITRDDASGHLFVAAGGNGGSDGIGDNNDRYPHYPSSYPNSNIVAVAATNATDARARFSNFGATSVDLAAPGDGILSTLPGSAYGSYSDTSMATPHVAGVAALVKSQNLALDDAQIKARFPDTVDAKTGLDGKVLTGGRLNAAGAVGQATTRKAQPRDTNVPSIRRVLPIAGSTISDRTPTVAATVRDDQTTLAKSEIRLYVDGRKKSTLSYSPATDRLKYGSDRLPTGRHTVRIVATDAAGNTGDEGWNFRIQAG